MIQLANSPFRHLLFKHIWNIVVNFILTLIFYSSNADTSDEETADRSRKRHQAWPQSQIATTVAHSEGVVQVLAGVQERKSRCRRTFPTGSAIRAGLIFGRKEYLEDPKSLCINNETFNRQWDYHQEPRRALYGPVTSIATPAGFLTHVQEI